MRIVRPTWATSNYSHRWQSTAVRGDTPLGYYPQDLPPPLVW